MLRPSVNGPPNRRRCATALAVIGGALALAACGSSGGKSAVATGSRDYASFLKFSECMRSHGVPNFPDPSPGGGGIQLRLGSGLDPQSPAFQSAQQACRHLLPGGGPHPLSESQKLAMLRFAQCMREHGVPSFPDPTFPAGGGVIERTPQTNGVNPDSPAFQKAARACGGPFKAAR